ncbi:rhomboid family intramembrane serine protease [Salipiger aestuarii]|uniref:rhomboid family intramembrane serine protease n=1 Tax=Salipiger aestuarii TaxID=568098 RepID=UPI00025B6B4C|nr:rhomboid family intramembrane serine protease [Salipiger aestuarii]EIE49052.1 rhomboid-like protein [Citreicella sp. 357]
MPPPETGPARMSAARWVWVGPAVVFVLIEALLSGADAGLWGSPLWRPLAYQYGGFWAGLLHGWQANYPAQPLAMFATYPFLHAGWQHLLGNLVVFGWLGEQIGRSFGAARLAALLAISALGGGACFGLLTTSPRPMVGASGAIMGLVAAWIAGEAHEMARNGQPRARILRMCALRSAAVLALNLAGTWIEAGGLAWETHLGGFVAAALALVTTLRPLRQK